MTDRDHFAAAALTGLLSNVQRYQNEPLTRQAFEIADFMLRERCRGGGDCPSQDNVYCTVNHDAAPAAIGDARECASPVTTGGKPAIDRLREWERHGSGRWGLGAAGDVTMLERRLAMVEEIVHDAAPAAIATEPEPEPAARRRPAGGTGDTQSFDAYRRFVGEVMNWISEATSAYASSCGSDGGMKIMADACSRCWDAFDRIAHTDHGASPEARASVDSVAPQPTTRGDSDRTDKAAPRPSEGTGDTPYSPQPIKCSVFDRSKPIARPTPVHTPPAHATPGECSVPRDGTEPVAWGVANGSRVLATSISRMDAVDMQSDYAYHTEIVPLYRHPPCQDFSQKNLTLTDAERKAVAFYSRFDTPQNGPVVGGHAAALRGLLERLGGVG